MVKILVGQRWNLHSSLRSQLQHLPDSVAGLVVPDGDIQVYLTWNNNADLQLLVRDPVGQSVYDDVPQVTSGGLLAANGNVGCTVQKATHYHMFIGPMAYYVREHMK